MAFGKRGEQGGSISRPAFATAAPTADGGNEPGLLGRFFGGNGGEEFDIDLSHLQPYGHGKSVTMLILCWLFTGTLGGHRFYLGHWFIASAMLCLGVTGVILIRIHIAQMIQSLQPNATAEPSAALWYLLLVLGIVQGIWWLVDGIYVIWRMLSAKVNG